MNNVLPLIGGSIPDRTYETIVDNFAGGGGASTGFELGLGRSPDVAINHDPEAIAMHKANHPDCIHHCQSVWEVSPTEVARMGPIGALWLSPDCKHFSKAKGSKPKDKCIRDLAWVAHAWAQLPRHLRPRVIFLENVEEFKTWGPLDGEGTPIKERFSEIFNDWVSKLQRLGYKVEWREIRACDFGAPTIRKRLFLIARCDGRPIIWAKETHGKPADQQVLSGKIRTYRTAADIIDWTMPCKSIFGRKTPLVEKTMIRIAKGIKRYVIDTDRPFIAPGIARASFLTEHANGSSQRVFDINEPLRTQCAQVKGGHFALCSAFIVKHFGGVVGTDIRNPYPTILTAGSQNQLVAAYMTKLRGTNIGADMKTPLHTISAGGTHHAEVRAFLIKYYGQSIAQDLHEPLGTVTTRDRFGLVMVHGEPYQIIDIGMRMLTPRELFNAQGFPENYIIDPTHNGKKLTIKSQVHKCGNSVSPPPAAALIRANVPELARLPLQAAE